MPCSVAWTLQPGRIVCKKILPGRLEGQWRLREESTAAVAITLAREAQILNLPFSVRMWEMGRPEK